MRTNWVPRIKNLPSHFKRHKTVGISYQIITGVVKNVFFFFHFVLDKVIKSNDLFNSIIIIIIVLESPSSICRVRFKTIYIFK